MSTQAYKCPSCGDVIYTSHCHGPPCDECGCGMKPLPELSRGEAFRVLLGSRIYLSTSKHPDWEWADRYDAALAALAQTAGDGIAARLNALADTLATDRNWTGSVVDELRDLAAALAQRPAAPREGVRGSGKVIGYVDPNFPVFPRPGGCVLSAQVLMVRDPSDPHTMPLYTRSEDARDGEDAARLDWLDANHGRVVPIPYTGGASGPYRFSVREGVAEFAHWRNFATLREAIDARRLKEEGRA